MPLFAADGRRNNRGQKRRRRLTNELRAALVQHYDERKQADPRYSFDDLAADTGYARTNVYRWCRDRQKILSAAAKERTRRLKCVRLTNTGGRDSVFGALEKRLHAEWKARR